MSFTILFTPDGQPWRVPNGEIKTYLEKGYRRPDPNAAPLIPPSTAEITTPIDRVNVNTDSTTRIAKVLAGISTATVRTLKEKRPYASIEDLIAKVPLPGNANWTSYAAQLEFDQDAAE